MLNSLVKTVSKKAKRVGRGLGSGKGAKSGRGTTRHQTARESIPLWFEGGQNRLTKKFPLLRGKGKNKPSKIHITVTLDKLNIFSDDSKITYKSLQKKGIIRNNIIEKKARLKIVKGKKNLTKKIHLMISATDSAKKEVVAAGGSIL